MQTGSNAILLCSIIEILSEISTGFERIGQDQLPSVCPLPIEDKKN